METSLYRLERGDPSKLDGRALIYATVIVPPANLVYPALYVGSSLLDVLDSNERKNFEEIIRTTATFKDEINRDRPIKALGDERELLTFVVRSLFTKDKKELVKHEGDIINIGRSYPELAEIAMDGIARAYMATYAVQWKDRMSAMQGAPGERTIEDLSCYEPEQLQRRLYSLTGELLDGVSRQDNAKVKRIKDALVDFGNRANCRRELEGLIELAIGEHPHKLILTQKQAEMITAIKAERYEQAAQLRDEIKALSI